MSRDIRCLLAMSLFLAAISFPSYCAAAGIEELVDQYTDATDIQRKKLEERYQGQSISARGIVQDVKEENAFDETKDVSKSYYKAITQTQQTQSKNPYQVIFVYKDVSKVKDINRGQEVEASGKLIRIIDERLLISVWLGEEAMSQEDKKMFRWDEKVL